MTEPLTFSECLQQIMHKHKLSLGNLAAMIGSRADLRHVLADDATPIIRNRLFQKLQESCLFEQADYTKLKQSLEISCLGVERYRFQRAIEGILAGRPFETPVDIMTDSGCSLTERMSTLMSAEKIEIICFNSCFHSLVAALKPLFDDPERDIHMRHYLHSAANYSLSAEYVESVLPIIFDPRYFSYIRNASVETQMPCISGNLLFIRAILKNEIIEMCFAFPSEQMVYEMPEPAAASIFSFVSKILQNIKPQPCPIKEEYPHQMDFPSLCMTFLSHELNRATYAITNDLCFQQTPTDIAVAAFLDKGMTSDEESEKIIRRTLSIHEQRYQNLYHKKKNTYRIMTVKGCEDFLSSGESAEHFVGFRAFTPQERKVIFGNMLQAAKENPFFIPLLLKDNQFNHKYNLVCYEKLGVSIDVKDTDYDISNGYRSVFLMHPVFTKQYMDYYLEILVPDKCYTRQKSLEMLEKMYDAFLIRYSLNN